MRAIPLLQVALDYVSLPPAIAMAVTVANEVDIIEIGTPLCKAAGVDAIRAIREVCPDKLILADFKSPDVGGLEAQLAFDAGADMMTVIGGAPLATVESALQAAKDNKKEMLMELTGVRDITARATEWRQIGVERMVYHRGWDEQAFNRQWGQDDLVVIQQLIDMGFKMTITGGITLETISFFKDLSPSVIIAGRAIHQTPDPAASARAIRTEIHRLWGGPAGHLAQSGHGVGSESRFVDQAAKAIRFGVSEMGLWLTVDGGNCPGCDSPSRYCRDSRTAIYTPPGVNAADIVQSISGLLGHNSAYGLENPKVFFLDPAHLRVKSPDGVIELLRATGNALRSLGCPVDVNAGTTVANQVLES